MLLARLAEPVPPRRLGKWHTMMSSVSPVATRPEQWSKSRVGQICADSIGERMFSGVGGQHDFMYGGSLSEGGKTFIAITATSPKGHSKIKPVLTSGAGVVTTRAQAQYIVTEHGIAYLRGKDLAQRARALIAIADPSVREELEKAACKRFGYSFLRVK